MSKSPIRRRSTVVSNPGGRNTRAGAKNPLSVSHSAVGPCTIAPYHSPSPRPSVRHGVAVTPSTRLRWKCSSTRAQVPALLWCASSTTSSWKNSRGNRCSRLARVWTEATCTGWLRSMPRLAATRPCDTPMAVSDALACRSSSCRCTSTQTLFPLVAVCSVMWLNRTVLPPPVGSTNSTERWRCAKAARISSTAAAW